MKKSILTNLTIQTIAMEVMFFILSYFLKFNHIYGDFSSLIFAMAGVGFILSFFMLLTWVLTRLVIEDEV